MCVVVRLDNENLPKEPGHKRERERWEKGDGRYAGVVKWGGVGWGRGERNRKKKKEALKLSYFYPRVACGMFLFTNRFATATWHGSGLRERYEHRYCWETLYEMKSCGNICILKSSTLTLSLSFSTRYLRSTSSRWCGLFSSSRMGVIKLNKT